MSETEKSAAVLTIRDADKMTPKGRRAVADWMRKQATFLEEHGKEFAGQFRARYMYRRKK